VLTTTSCYATPISTASNRPGKAIKVGSDPFAIAITPNSKTVYVANLHSGNVTPIATATNKSGKAIATGLSLGPSRSRGTARLLMSPTTARTP
jgi:YVTN family beta-propeller protein